MGFGSEDLGTLSRGFGHVKTAPRANVKGLGVSVFGLGFTVKVHLNRRADAYARARSDRTYQEGRCDACTSKNAMDHIIQLHLAVVGIL